MVGEETFFQRADYGARADCLDHLPEVSAMLRNCRPMSLYVRMRLDSERAQLTPASEIKRGVRPKAGQKRCRQFVLGAHQQHIAWLEPCAQLSENGFMDGRLIAPGSAKAGEARADQRLEIVASL